MIDAISHLRSLKKSLFFSFFFFSKTKNAKKKKENGDAKQMIEAINHSCKE